MSERIIVVGAGMGGLAAAVRAADLGAEAVLLEKGPCVGGAASFSGGQVWIGGNHVAARRGIDDSVADTLGYVHAIAAKRDAASIDPALAERWIATAPVAAQHFEDIGVITWEIIDGYPDYYPDATGGRSTGRYLTGALFDGKSLGAWRDKLLVSPYFLVGVRYAELFAWGGVSSRQHWDWDLIERRRAEDWISFGPGVTAPFFRAAIERGVDLRLECPVVELIERDGAVAGVRVEQDGHVEDIAGTVILATGGHDWSRELADRFLDLPWEFGGSIAPPTLTGDGLALGEAVGAEVRTIPSWAAPVLPGYQIDASIYPGDQGFRNCLESGLPHTFMVNARGERFCDDSFHSDIVYAALKRDEKGKQPNLPLFMIWDSQHHRKYGLGLTKPGQTYPDGLVTSAPTLRQLGAQLGIDPERLAVTAQAFSESAREGRDPAFARGSNPSVQVFRGDAKQQPSVNLGTVEEPPFFGMKLRLLSTGIAAGGLAVDRHARVLRADGGVIDGLYAVGECAARDTGGVGYNSGYSLSRAMTFGYIAAGHAAGGVGMIGYGTLFQVGYVVDDLDAALEHWTGRLRVGPFFSYPSPMPWVSLTVHGAPAADTNVIDRVALAYSGALMIELIQPGPAASPYRDFLAAGGSGVQHLGAATDRFDADRARALGDGGRELMAGVLPASRFSYIAFDDGFPGSVLELIELGPERRQLFEAIKAAAHDWDGSDPVRAATIGSNQEE